MMRLSSLTPSSMTVSSTAPRSTVVFAPISTSTPLLRGESETITANHGAWLHDGAGTHVDATTESDLRREINVLRKRYVVFQYAVRTHVCTRTNHDALPNHT